MENHSHSPNARVPPQSCPLSPRYASRLRSRSGGSRSSGSALTSSPTTSSLKAPNASPRRRSPGGGYSSRHIPSRAHLPSFSKGFETSFSSPIATSTESSVDFSPSDSPPLSRSRRHSSTRSPYKRQRSPYLSPSHATDANATNRTLFPPPPQSPIGSSPTQSVTHTRSSSLSTMSSSSSSFGGDPPLLSLPPVYGAKCDVTRCLPLGPPLGALEYDAQTSSGHVQSPYRRLNFSAGRGNENFVSARTPVGAFAPHSPCHPFARSPIDDVSFRMPVQQKRPRHIASQPYKILDAPSLKDDFYLNLVDWSSSNLLAVGLGSSLYLWSACNSKVTKLCDVTRPPSSSSATGNGEQRRSRGSPVPDYSNDYVTSVSWAEKGSYLAIGTEQGQVQLWDVEHGGCSGKLVQEFEGHDSRVGALAWNGRSLVSGSRDRHILMHDTRQGTNVNAKFLAHKQEVCGLKWSSDDDKVLASGGNDNKLMLWDARKGRNPFQRFSEHTAAVKAIAWSPHTHGLLASGGGTADRCIRFWDTLSAQENSQKCVDTGSQVCNLAWSKNVDEIVSTHGYSLNQIVIWNAPSMTKVKTLTGHSYRVLYLAASPDGQTVVTGAGDETLRFWSVFPESPHRRASHNRRAIPFTISRSCELR